MIATGYESPVWIAAIDIGWPQPLFNPLISPEPLKPRHLIAGPLGLLAFLPFAILLRFVPVRYWPAAMMIASLIWLVVTLRPMTASIFLAFLGASLTFLYGLRSLRRSGRVNARVGIALVWIVLHAMLVPLWWWSHPDWYPSPMAPLHAVGFAYLLLRLIEWGVSICNDPSQPMPLAPACAWLLYPPAMRNGPVVRWQDFIGRWQSFTTQPNWRAALPRFALLALGLAALSLAVAITPKVQPGEPDFFSAPSAYSTGQLLTLCYLVPIQVYLFLWSYAEIAAAISILCGLPVGDNFRCLPAATSTRDFWRRWNTSVGRFLRDCIYIPLGGNRTPIWLTAGVVFAYCAIWHGPCLSFLIWGGLQVVAIAIETAWERRRTRFLPPADAANPLPRPLWKAAACWLGTMHFQGATIVVFADFQYFGLRLFPELLKRILPA